MLSIADGDAAVISNLLEASRCSSGEDPDQPGCPSI